MKNQSAQRAQALLSEFSGLLDHAGGVIQGIQLAVAVGRGLEGAYVEPLFPLNGSRERERGNPVLEEPLNL